jgi:Leucine-rich repeat (LRR) protein
MSKENFSVERLWGAFDKYEKLRDERLKSRTAKGVSDYFYKTISNEEIDRLSDILTLLENIESAGLRDIENKARDYYEKYFRLQRLKGELAGKIERLKRMKRYQEYKDVQAEIEKVEEDRINLENQINNLETELKNILQEIKELTDRFIEFLSTNRANLELDISLERDKINFVEYLILALLDSYELKPKVRGVENNSIVDLYIDGREGLPPEIESEFQSLGLRFLQFFNNLKYLKLEDLSVPKIQEIPHSLEALYVDFCDELRELPENLPPSLRKLYCIKNPNLGKLPNLPNSLEELVVMDNGLTELPPLPVGLKKLWASGNEITILPDPLPESLEDISFSLNPLSENSVARLKRFKEEHPEASVSF